MNKLIRQIIEKLKERETQPLSPKQIWDQAIESEIESLSLPGMLSDRRAIALMAGLYLLNDSLDKSHSYAQQIEDDSTGAFWHGIMHRMEGDYSNAKYWFRRSGQHPALEITRQRIAEQFRDQSAWNSADFTDMVKLCESESASAGTRNQLERLQHIEISALFDYTYEAFKNGLL